MRVLVWLLRAVIFFMLFGLAIKNSGTVELRFFLNQDWQAPLSLVLLVAFTAGVIIGLAAAVGAWTRQRRELAELRARIETGPRDSA
ncbi:MAG: LapA family protein [Sulfurisoma sp.]|nr:LapA family protein [Sulfurisoma sp.]